MVTLGLDIATHTGMVRLEGEEGRGKVVEFPKERGFIRLQMIAAEVERTIEIWNPDLCAIEGYAFARNVDSYTRLVECGTVIRQVLYRRKLPWIEVSPTTLKKWVTGKGNAKKEDMAVSVKEKWSYESPSHDIVDAYALARLAQLPMVELVSFSGVTVVS